MPEPSDNFCCTEDPFCLSDDPAYERLLWAVACVNLSRGTDDHTNWSSVAASLSIDFLQFFGADSRTS